MKNDYIEINDKKYRVEFNWNAITEFLELEGLSLSDADDLKQLKPRQVTGLVYAGVCEGCRLDGKEFPFSKLEFGAMVKPPQIGDLLLIYQRHTSVKTKEATEANVGQKKRFLSRFRSN